MSGPESSQHRPVPNLEIPGFTVQAVAGRGGMGTVYRAEQASPRRLVALKLLTEKAASPESLAAFQREAHTIARLEHPHILPIYGFGENNGRPYLVLRYLSGGSVAERLQRGPIDPPTALRWMRGIADALDFAHSRGLVHRDIKPSNILLDQTGNPYLTDFGIAGGMLAAEGDRPTGSAPYMSPEQGRGEPVDHRADIYSLAVTLFEMLTGSRPYEAETPLGLIVRHISDPIPSARERSASVAPAVDELLRWGMAKQPDERPQTAGAFAKLLDRAIAQPNVPLRPDAAPTVPPAQSATVVVPGAGLPGAGAPGAAVPGQSATVVVPGAGRAARKPNTLVWVGVAVVGLCLLVTLALGGGAAALAFLSPSPTARPTATDRPTSTPAPSATPTPMGRLLADDFSDAGSGFGVTSTEQPDEGGGVAYQEGVLRFTVGLNGLEWISPSGRVTAQNVTIEAEVVQVGGPNRNEMALLCRFRPDDPTTPGNDERYVAFGINGLGEYAIWLKRQGEVVRLVEWTPVAGLASGPGARHRLSVACQDDRLYFEVDDQVLPEAEDSAPAAGDVALLAGLLEDGELVVDFDNVLVTE